MPVYVTMVCLRVVPRLTQSPASSHQLCCEIAPEHLLLDRHMHHHWALRDLLIHKNTPCHVLRGTQGTLPTAPCSTAHIPFLSSPWEPPGGQDWVAGMEHWQVPYKLSRTNSNGAWASCQTCVGPRAWHRALRGWGQAT